MSQFYVELTRSKLHRPKDNSGTSWRHQEPFATFDNPTAFMDYIRDHRGDLDNVVAFSGSASTIQACNSFIENERKKAKALCEEAK